MRVAMIGSMCALMLGCAASAKNVEVKGEVEDVVLLAGKWKGTYKGIQSGREGTVEFDLEVGRHHALGEVMMYPTQDRAKGRPLKIRFVQVKKGEIRGKITPYVDPRCKCQVNTEFLGRVQGNTIEGEFTTHLPGSARAHSGTWAVYRQRDRQN